MRHYQLSTINYQLNKMYQNKQYIIIVSSARFSGHSETILMGICTVNVQP
ncbi:MAG: hypothetical protein LBE12_10655 [Planctomycetaceae bacterium]|nr:hypothetical protein [Planctomycetaceae bacterium]